ncbi:hypothetical protein ACTJJB_05505 [Chitinophaga sp. 22536]|uniref:hypothetical protein n=1 Tax=unclassified Chitinophaga TaxID=2619133 RepID=UPI003F85F2D1
MLRILTYRPSEGGGGDINAGMLMNNTIAESQKVEKVPHELYHGYQDEYGESGATINVEVGKRH